MHPRVFAIVADPLTGRAAGCRRRPGNNHALEFAASRVGSMSPADAISFNLQWKSGGAGGGGGGGSRLERRRECSIFPGVSAPPRLPQTNAAHLPLHKHRRRLAP